MTTSAIPVAVVCDNTMGIPGGEIDDGLALLYLLGCAPESVRIELVATTHGNAPTCGTDRATRWLCDQILPDAPVLRGSDAPAPGENPATSDAARGLVELAWNREAGTVALLSLGATTELAAAERLRPGTRARFGTVCLMGGLSDGGTVGVGDGPDVGAPLVRTGRTRLAAALRTKPYRYNDVCQPRRNRAAAQKGSRP